MQGSSYAEESPESLWKRNLQVTALSHAGDDEVVMSFVFRNGQIAAVASASGEEEIKAADCREIQPPSAWQQPVQIFSGYAWRFVRPVPLPVPKH